ncbi:MAG: hypothetical protein WCF57_12890 [Pyrinomonadaceae bacterium]
MRNSNSLKTALAMRLTCVLLVAATIMSLFAVDGRTYTRFNPIAPDETPAATLHETEAVAADTISPATDETDETAKASDDTPKSPNDTPKASDGTPPAPAKPEGEQPPPSSDAADADKARVATRLQGRTIIVNDRALTGPASTAQHRGGRIFLPAMSIARALGDTIKMDVISRTVEVHRQTGTRADFTVELRQVRENGSIILTVSNTADIVFPPNPEELMLPLEIVSALLDVSIHMDEAAQAIKIRRGHEQSDTVRTGEKRAAFELYQVEYDYNLNRYSSSSDQNLTLRASGRLWDGRFNLLTNSSRARGVAAGLLRNFTVTFERPNGQRFTGGDFGTGTDLLFMSSTVRGASAQVQLGRARVTAFGGRAISGVYLPQTFVVPGVTDTEERQQQDLFQQNKARYDTSIFGAYATFDLSTSGSSPRSRQFQLAAGALHFNGPNRSGDLVTASARYASARSRFQGDVGFGRFKGIQFEGISRDGLGIAADLSASFDVSDSLTLQGRYTHVSENFMGPQSGMHEPLRLMTGGLNWRPTGWLTASLTASFSTRPDALRQRERFIAAAFNITPRNGWPTIFFSHTQSSTTQVGHGAFTLLNASKTFSRWNLYLNATRIKTLGPAFLNAQVGASLRLNEYNTLQLGQSFGSRGSLGGTVDWQMQSLLKGRVQLGAGFGYNRSQNAPIRTTERLFASVSLPRQSTLQFTYLQSQTGPQMLLSLRGSLFRQRVAELAANAPISEINSYGAFYGRVYQDINLNGRYDPGLDTPQANVKVRVDGNRYVVSDESGRYRIDNIHTGAHNVYLDLLTVRADLTLLDGAQQAAALLGGRDSIVDFRLVRTGRITGIIWLDLNGNGHLDQGEQPLPDVRLVAGSLRDTLTDENGAFVIGDLPPGEHVILVDEKTLPEKMVSPRGTLSVKVLAGNETANVNFAITPAPAQIKRFPLAVN